MGEFNSSICVAVAANSNPQTQKMKGSRSKFASFLLRSLDSFGLIPPPTFLFLSEIIRAIGLSLSCSRMLHRASDFAKVETAR
ncbi:hypothetical protein TNCV_3187371 [Trichonephila clavipes]|nr:hypothetical protein TNCV_3187371 [Trichonephila clavipes]